MTAEIPSYSLNDDTTLPAIGFGTYKLNGVRGAEAIREAISYGYRLLDSAYNYENEGAVGEAVKQCGIPRDELYVCSKLPGRYHRKRAAVDTVHESLYRAGLDYYDLYLIHWPNPSKDLYVEAWSTLIDLKAQGLIRSIGVCNFLPEHLDRLAAETGVVPSVNQVELHPYFPQRRQREYDAAHGIRTQSWSPLGRAGAMLRDPVITQIAEAHGKTTGQTILRWHIQLGSIPVPKSAHAERQRDNIAVFDFTLTDAEMSAITALGRDDGRTEDQNPAVYEEF